MNPFRSIVIPGAPTTTPGRPGHVRLRVRTAFVFTTCPQAVIGFSSRACPTGTAVVDTRAPRTTRGTIVRDLVHSHPLPDTRTSSGAAGLEAIGRLPYARRVRTLGERDVSALADLTAELALLEDADAFPPHLLATLAQLVPSETVFYNEIDRDRDLKLVSTWWHDGVGGADPPEEDTLGPEHDPYFLFWEQHPACSYRAQANGWTSTRKVS